MKPKLKIDPADRDLTNPHNMETVMRRLMETPVETRTKSESHLPKTYYL